MKALAICATNQVITLVERRYSGSRSTVAEGSIAISATLAVITVTEATTRVEMLSHTRARF